MSDIISKKKFQWEPWKMSKTIFILYAIFSCYTPSALALDKTTFGLIKTIKDGGTEKFFVDNPELGNTAYNQGVATSEAVADEIKALHTPGSYRCNGKIYATQIFEISDCRTNSDSPRK
ncbi:MAG: hypothetical protein ACXVB9_07850 [Bdellovibrionota bacterium]